jgi:hypothetical protein
MFFKMERREQEVEGWHCRIGWFGWWLKGHGG